MSHELAADCDVATIRGRGCGVDGSYLVWLWWCDIVRNERLEVFSAMLC